MAKNAVKNSIKYKKMKRKCRKMNKEKVIEQLESLKAHCEDMARCSAGDSDWNKDVKAIEVAINIIKDTAQEVPVQEQYLGICPQCNSQNKLMSKRQPKFCMNCSKKISYRKNLVL